MKFTLIESINTAAYHTFSKSLYWRKFDSEKLLLFIFRWPNPRGHSELPVFLLLLLDLNDYHFPHVQLLGTQMLIFRWKKIMCTHHSCARPARCPLTPWFPGHWWCGMAMLTYIGHSVWERCHVINLHLSLGHVLFKYQNYFKKERKTSLLPRLIFLPLFGWAMCLLWNHKALPSFARPAPPATLQNTAKFSLSLHNI